MTNQTPNSIINNDQEPFIPPSYMLILAAIGFAVAAVVALTQPELTVVFWGGLGIGLLSLVVWAFMAPDQVRAIITGRTARYGGSTLIVTLIFIVALAAIYAFVKGRSLRLDLTQRETYSLTTEARAVISQLAVEPNVPNIKVFAFYSEGQGGIRDQITVLLDDYVKTSNNKISYEFVDPDRNPVLAQQYTVTRSGPLAVVPLDAAGQPLPDKVEMVNSFTQEALSNAILSVSASGDFNAYFLAVNNGLKLEGTDGQGMSELNNLLKDRFNWKTQEVTLIDLVAPNSAVKLNDPNVDGEVLVIAGGDKALPDEQVKFISDYLDKGGSLVILAAPLNADNSPTLATGDSLSAMLYDKFGVRFSTNVILDQVQSAAAQSPFYPASIEFDSTSYITKDFAGAQNLFMVFETPHSIDVAPTLPAGVTVTELAKSGADAYAKTDASLLTATDATLFVKTDSDAQGPFVLAATAENSTTKARVVLLGSLYTASNQYAALASTNVLNLEVAVRSLFWTSGFDTFFSQIPTVTAPQRLQDTPIFADAQTTRTINFVTLILLPFGVLFIGLLVWWNSRERRQA